jgi:hypothetical protein
VADLAGADSAVAVLEGADPADAVAEQRLKRFVEPMVCRFRLLKPREIRLEPVPQEPSLLFLPAAPYPPKVREHSVWKR